MISVIVPVYNTAPSSLLRAKKSLDAQTAIDFEVLWVDDGSREETASFLSRFSSKQHRVIRQENRGVYEARWRGLSEARGEWIFFLDADDYLEPDAFARLERARKEKDADLVIASFFEEKEGGTPRPYPFRGRSETLSRERFAKRFFTGIKIRGFVWGKLYRAELLRAAASFMYPKRLFEDACIAFLTGVSAKRIAYLSAPLYHYVVGNASSLTGEPNPRRLEDHLYAFARLKEWMVGEGEEALLSSFRGKAFILKRNLSFDRRLSVRAGLGKSEAKRLYREGVQALFGNEMA